MSDFLGAIDRYKYPPVAGDISPARRYSIVTSSETSPISLPFSVAKRSEDEILVTLPPYRRWEFIAVHHPVEFWGIIVAGIAAAIVAVQTVWDTLPHMMAWLISTAHAEEKSGTVISFGAIGISTQAFVSVLLAIVLFWFMGVVSRTTVAANATFARDTIKSLIGFFVGLGTGAVTK